MTAVIDLLDEQNKTFEAFRTANDKMTRRMDRLETAFNRPGTGGGDDGDLSEELKAWDVYLRKGREGMLPDEMKILTVGDDVRAGFLAPKERVREIIKAATVFSPIRTIARIRTTSQKAVEIPKRTAQFSAAWVAEQGGRSETTGLTYGLEELPTNEMYALVDVSNQMLEDTDFDLNAELTTEFGEQFGVLEGTAFVNGTAVGQPEGFMTNTDVATTNSGSATTIADTDGQANGIIDLIHAVKEAYAVNATFALNRTTLGAVRKLKDVSSGAGSYLWQPGIQAGLPNTILGHPYVEATDMPDEGAGNEPIAFGDFRRAYTIVDRIVMSVLADPFTQSTSGNTRFVARRRIGGQVMLAEAIRTLTCAV